jgi:hypothetical protein
VSDESQHSRARFRALAGGRCAAAGVELRGVVREGEQLFPGKNRITAGTIRG